MSYEGSGDHIDKLTFKQALDLLHYIDEQDDYRWARWRYRWCDFKYDARISDY